MKQKLFIVLSIAVLFVYSSQVNACTGITLKSKDGSTIVARTIEWGGSNLNSQYVIVPRGYSEQSYVPNGTDGMFFTARYGYAGLAVEQKEFVAEGLNEVGLSAGLFYFPDYGKYENYDVTLKDKSIADLQLVAWILGLCKTVEEVKEAILKVHIVHIDPRASTVHWRFTDTSGKIPVNIPSATQWTSATDMKNQIIYYRTMYNNLIRSIDLRTIDFSRISYQAAPLDKTKKQNIEIIKVK